MKKIAAGFLALSLVLAVSGFTVFAAGPNEFCRGAARGALAGQGFADADGDGVCDHYAAGRGQGFADADGDGICDNRGGRGQGFADADGDGVCDHYAAGCGGGRNAGVCRRYAL